jgi:hypothetical protein
MSLELEEYEERDSPIDSRDRPIICDPVSAGLVYCMLHVQFTKMGLDTVFLHDRSRIDISKFSVADS